MEIVVFVQSKRVFLDRPSICSYNGYMEQATISQLKNRLSAYLRIVKAGGSVLVFDRDEPVARLERVEAGSAGSEWLTRLEKEGLIHRGSGAVPLELLRKPRPKSGKSVLEALIEERRSGR